MLSFLAALAFTPVVLGLLWIYMSPLRRLDGHTVLKVVIRVVLFVAVMGVWFAQLGFLAYRVPSNARRFYVISLLAIEAIPMLYIVFSRDPHRRRSKSANHIDDGAG